MKKRILSIILIIALIGSNIYALSGVSTDIYDIVDNDSLTDEQIGQALYLLALSYFEEENYEQALVAILESDKYIKTEDNYILQLSIYNELNDNNNMLITLNELLELDGNNTLYLSARASLYVERDEIELAILDLERVIALGEGDENTYSMIVELYISQDDNQKAYEYSKELLKFDESSEYIFIILQLATNLELFDMVLFYGEMYEEKLESDDSFILLANAYYRLQQYEEALEILEKIVEKTYDVYLQMGYIAYFLEEYEQAILYFEAAYELDQTEEVEAIIEEFSSFYEEQEIETSEEDTEQFSSTYEEQETEISEETTGEVVTVSDEEWSYYYYSIENYEKAIECMISYQKSNPAEGQDYYIALCYSQLGDTENAKLYYTYSIDKNEEVGNSSYNRGVIYLNDEAYEEAIIDFGTAYELGVNPDYAIYNQGIAYMSCSQFVESTQCFLTVLEISDDADLIEQAEDILSRYYVT